MSTGPAEHAADEAGGEVVYSSDGLDPLPKQRRPPTLSAVALPTGQDALIESYEVSAEQAFEIFAGKVYYHPTGATTTQQPSSGAAPAAVRGETALERLSRLQRELDEMERDMQVHHVQPTDDDAAFLKSVQQLQVKLLKTKGAIPTHKALSLQIQESAAVAASLSTTAKPVVPPTDPIPKLSSGGAATTTSAPTITDKTLEIRLQRMEQAVGAASSKHTYAASSTATAGRSLMERLTVLEDAILGKLMDESKLDALQKKTKVIRQDLEAASKARNKLLVSDASSSGGGGGRSDDAKTITELHDQMVLLQGMSQHLPALVQRLQALAHTHAAVTTWSTRLKATEEAASQMQNQLTVLEEALNKLQASLQENAVKMVENVKALDERMNQIS